MSQTSSQYQRQQELANYQPLKRGEPYSFFSKVGGTDIKIKNPIVPDNTPQADNFNLNARTKVRDIKQRAISAMNTVHIDKEIDSKLFRFGKMSTSTNNIEN